MITAILGKIISGKERCFKSPNKIRILFVADGVRQRILSSRINKL